MVVVQIAVGVVDVVQNVVAVVVVPPTVATTVDPSFDVLLPSVVSIHSQVLEEIICSTILVSMPNRSTKRAIQIHRLCDHLMDIQKISCQFP